ncbi:helix-turn-helix domain-containing protein [bacterium]|nr:helix-turn-helix domain-containing protein [bacterium]
MNLAKLGERIRRRREAMKLSQVQLAHSLHISPQAVSKWERGINAPDLSVMPLLSSVLQISLDDLISGQSAAPTTFPAAVLTTSIRGFARRAAQLLPNEVALILNSIFQPLTQTVLAHKGVPVKYLGDGFLAYFSGPNHTHRAIQALQQILKLTIDSQLVISVSEGPIYLGPIGEGDYARPDIIGDSVNLAFLLNQWAAETTTLSHVLTIPDALRPPSISTPPQLIQIGDRSVMIQTIVPLPVQ